MHFISLTYFSNYPLHVLNILTIHHQEVALLYMQHMVFIILKNITVVRLIGPCYATTS